MLRGEVGDGGTIRFPYMKPASRPEWASPIEVGKHVRSFHSALSEQPTREVLHALHNDPKLLTLLERRELGKLEFSTRLPAPSWNGAYDRLTSDVTINAFRAPDTYGQEFFPPDVASVSAAGRNLVEAMQRSLYHEIGHHILEICGPAAERQVAQLLRSGKAFPVSRRAGKRGVEYFAETFCAYRFEDALADKDPEGYHMVEAILRLAGKL